MTFSLLTSRNMPHMQVMLPERRKACVGRREPEIPVDIHSRHWHWRSLPQIPRFRFHFQLYNERRVGISGSARSPPPPASICFRSRGRPRRF